MYGFERVNNLIFQSTFIAYILFVYFERCLQGSFPFIPFVIDKAWHPLSGIDETNKFSHALHDLLLYCIHKVYTIYF